MTKNALKGKKKDTIQGMYMRLSDYLAASRQILNEAYELGNNKHKWQTPIDDPDNRDAKRLKTALSGSSSKVSFTQEEESPVTLSKPITKRNTQNTQAWTERQSSAILVVGTGTIVTSVTIK